MSKEERVINYYVLCNRLKDVVRTGWNNWKVERNRIESVADHIFGVQMLALAMKSEYEYDIDIVKVIYMLAIHELGETIIGDLTQFEITKGEKEKIEHAAVHKILSSLLDGEEIEALYLEYDAKKTPEAMFADQCDKLEGGLQSKLYDQELCVNLNDQMDNPAAQNEMVQKLLESGESWSGMWLEYGLRKYQYDDNFRAVSKYAKEHYIDEGFARRRSKSETN